MKSYWNRKRILIKSNLYKITRIPPSSYKSKSLPIVRANNSWKKEEKVFLSLPSFLSDEGKKIIVTSKNVGHANLRSRSCSGGGFRFNPPPLFAPFASSHSTDIVPILRPLYYTIARHVVTLSEPRETCGFTCLFVILPPPFVRSDDLMLHFVSFSVSRRNIWIYYGIFVIFFFL